MKMLLQRFVRISTLSLAICLLAGADSARAAVFTENFTSPHGGLPTGWVSSSINGSTVAITERAPDDWRLMLRRDSASQQLVYYAGSSSSISPNGAFSDFEGSVIMRTGASGSDVRGIALRGSTISNTIYYNGYFLYTNGTSIILSEKPVNTTINGTILATKTLSSAMSSNTDYLVTFSANKSLLTGAIYRKDSEGDFSVLLGSVSTSDATYTSGFFGFRNMSGANTRATYFSDLTIQTIPEPSSMALLGLAGVALLFRSPIRGMWRASSSLSCKKENSILNSGR